MAFRSFGSTKPNSGGFPPPPGFGFGGPTAFCMNPAVPVELHEGVFIELRSDDEDNLRFKIDCDVENLASEKVQDQLNALAHLEACFGQFATIPDTAAATDTTIACRLRTPLFSCNTILVRMEVLDMLMYIVAEETTATTTVDNDDIEHVLLCKKKAIKLIDSVTSADMMCSVKWATTKPKLHEVLFAAAMHPETSTTHSTLLEITAHHSSHRQSIFRTISTCLKSDPPCDAVFSKAVKLFTLDAVEEDQRAEFLDILADSLRDVMTEDTSCSHSRFVTLVALLTKVRRVWLSGHVPLMEALLQVVCFHSDASVRNTSLDLLITLGEPFTLCYLPKENNHPALDWWTQRCLPTWVDLLVEWTKLNESECDTASLTINTKLLDRIQELLDANWLPAEGIPDISRFAVELVDGGGYEKLKATMHWCGNCATTWTAVRILSDSSVAMCRMATSSRHWRKPSGRGRATSSFPWTHARLSVQSSPLPCTRILAPLW